MRNQSTGMVMVVVVSLLGGCATRTKTGAAVGGVSGAAVGAGVGALAGGPKGALIGAGVGAAAGAGAGALIGRYMDKQAEAMKKNVKTAQVVRQGDKLLVQFNSQILFDTNEAKLKQQSIHDLSEFAKVLNLYPDTNLLIEGHTDSTGPRDFNERLSVDRAQSVVAFLRQEDVGRDRLAARGFADTEPAASNTTEEGRRLNRRVQIEITANEALKREAAATAAASQPQKAPVVRASAAR
jgi:outer membrane protein OmpA-like peptidoglycan-associated protein